MAAANLDVDFNEKDEQNSVNSLFELGDLKEFINDISLFIENDERQCILFIYGANKSFAVRFEIESILGADSSNFLVDETNIVVLETTNFIRIVKIFNFDEYLAFLCEDGYLFWISRVHIQKQFYANLCDYSPTSISIDDPLYKKGEVKFPKSPSIYNITALRNGLVILRSDESSWFVDIYHDAVDSQNKSFSSNYKRFCLHSIKNQFEENQSVRPVIACVHSTKVDDSQLSTITSWLCKFLFGEEALITQSDIIFVGLPDGQVYGIVLKCLYENETLVFLEDSSLNSKLLCCVNQQIVGIFFLSITEDRIEGHDLGSELDDKNTLAIVGRNGKIIIFHQAAIQMPSCPIEFQIPGPVWTCELFGNFLIYSDGTCIKVLDLADIINKGNKKQMDFPTNVTILSELNSVISFFIMHFGQNLDNNKTIFITLSGQILCSTLLFSKRTKRPTPPIHADNIPQILSAIEDYSRSLQKINNLIEYQKTLIHSLAVASTLLLNKKAKDNFEISFKVHLYIHDQTQITVEVELKNRSPFVLSKSLWHFALIAFWTLECNDNVNETRWIKSSPLKNDLIPNGSIKMFFTIPVQLWFDRWQFPLEVIPLLQLLMPESCIPRLKLRSNANVKGFSPNSTLGPLFPLITLELSKITIDELFLLKTADEQSVIPKATSLCQKIWTLNSQRPLFRELTTHLPLSPTGCTFPLEISLSKELFNTVIKGTSTEALLEYILQNINICCIAKEKIVSSKAASIASHSVLFRMHEQNGLNFLTVESNQLFLTSRLRAAILRRLQEKQMSDGTGTKSLILASSSLLEIKNLMQEINWMSTYTDEKEFLTAIYRKLRCKTSCSLPFV